ncbi:putative SWAP/Surp superfamily protein [Helianthus annuus]|nr:putative SWAP/Surp superfamily protein [Helianthus annuus]
MENSTPESVATHTRTTGIIHPPPDIRTIVDKTASFVAKNGPEFENRIIGRNAGNPNFNFLNGSDPYHAYYQHRLAEFRAQAQAPGQQSLDAPEPESTPSILYVNFNLVR